MQSIPEIFTSFNKHLFLNESTTMDVKKTSTLLNHSLLKTYSYKNIGLLHLVTFRVMTQLPQHPIGLKIWNLVVIYLNELFLVTSSPNSEIKK